MASKRDKQEVELSRRQVLGGTVAAGAALAAPARVLAQGAEQDIPNQTRQAPIDQAQEACPDERGIYENLQEFLVRKVVPPAPVIDQNEEADRLLRRCRVTPPDFDPITKRADLAQALRVRRARLNRRAPLPPDENLCNGDDLIYQDTESFPFIGSYSKGLNHNRVTGEVRREAYLAYKAALQLKDVAEFDAAVEESLGTKVLTIGEARRVIAQAETSGERDAGINFFAQSLRSLDLGELPDANFPPAGPGAARTFAEAQANELIPLQRLQLTTLVGAASGVRDKYTREQGSRLLLENPLAPNAFTLEGQDPHLVGIFTFSRRRSEGNRPKVMVVPDPPRFRDDAEMAEMAELYWMALLRDVPFHYYTNEASPDDERAQQGRELVAAAVDDLGSRWGGYFGRPENGGPGPTDDFTGRHLFRGFTVGDRFGPYISQFLVRPVPMGRTTLDPRIRTAAMRQNLGGDPNGEGLDFMTDYRTWLQRQNGFVRQDEIIFNIIDPPFDREPRLLRSGRDGGEYVHTDIVFQEFLHACFILFTPPSIRPDLPEPGEPDPAPIFSQLDPRRRNPADDLDLDAQRVLPFTGGLFDPDRTPAPSEGRTDEEPNRPIRNPYAASRVQEGFVTLGNHDVKTMLGEVTKRALQTVWYQKWSVHRRLRPEEFGGRVHVHLARRRGRYNDHWSRAGFERLRTGVLPRIKAMNGTYLLPQAFGEGCPMHTAYGSGHSTTAGACATLLKAFVNDEARLSEIEYVDRMTGARVPAFVPVEPAPDGRTLRRYTGGDTDELTIGGELDKLASNESLFRNFAGVHWRTDYTSSLLLGQAVAIYYLCDVVNTYGENLSFTFNTFEGARIRISKEGQDTRLRWQIEILRRSPDGRIPTIPDLSGVYGMNYDIDFS